MAYINQFETELAKLIEGSDDTTRVVRLASEKILESYRDGINAAQKGVQGIRDGKSRRRDSSGNKN